MEELKILHNIEMHNPGIFKLFMNLNMHRDDSSNNILFICSNKSEAIKYMNNTAMEENADKINKIHMYINIKDKYIYFVSYKDLDDNYLVGRKYKEYYIL